MRLEPTDRAAEQRVHPDHDWFFVIQGRVRLSLGDREITVETGEAAEFTTMTPHAFAAVDEPAELIMIFDRDGQRAHIHHKPAPIRGCSPVGLAAIAAVGHHFDKVRLSYDVLIKQGTERATRTAM